MNELKTLKDLFDKDGGDILPFEVLNILRQEAIKIIKNPESIPIPISMNLYEDQTPFTYFNAINEVLIWFFNITDEDLK